MTYSLGRGNRPVPIIISNGTTTFAYDGDGYAGLTCQA